MLRNGYGHALQDSLVVTKYAAKAGAEALEREAAREEAERPKVTLAEMVTTLRAKPGNADCPDCAAPLAGYHCDGRRVRLDAAASTLKRLAEEGGKLLAWELSIATQAELASYARDVRDLLRSLGVEPKP
jgi:hypothetical protein